jgi:hypothetical protein
LRAQRRDAIAARRDDGVADSEAAQLAHERNGAIERLHAVALQEAEVKGVLALRERPRILRGERDAARSEEIALVLGVDRDCEALSALFDMRNEAVTATIAALLARARATGAGTGICGQAPSTHSEFVAFLVAHGIDSISVTLDGFLAVKRAVARAEGLT